MSWWYKFKKAFLTWVADIRIYPGGIILFGDSHYHLKGHHMRAILESLEPGDLLLRRYSHYLGSVTIPGYFSHAAVYTGNDHVVHMLGSGITREDILTFMHCDDLCVLRCKDKERSKVAVVRAMAQLRKGVQYDYDFDTENHEKFYCTEFVEYCFDYPTKERDLFEIKTILPDVFLASTVFDIVWGNADNKKKMSRKLKC